MQGVIGFFHPFADGGGGGERVLWYALSISKQSKGPPLLALPLLFVSGYFLRKKKWSSQYSADLTLVFTSIIYDEP